MEIVTCPSCNSTKLLKDGNKNGKQRYECKECKRKFTFGEYIKKDSNNIKSQIAHKKSNTKKVKEVIPQTITGDEIIINKLNNIIEDDIKNNNLDYEKYKELVSNNNSKVVNHIAKKLSEIDFNIISLLADNYLFKSNDEKFDSFIIKLLIFSSSKGVEKLMYIISNFNDYILNSHILNSIGKYLCEYLDYSWNITLPYFFYENKNINLIHVLTRYVSYIRFKSKSDLKNSIRMSDITKIYLDYDLLHEFKVDYISDSGYEDNFVEFTISLQKILSILAEADLIDMNFKKQHEDSIFTDDRLLDSLSSIYIQYTYKNSSDEEIIKAIEHIQKRNPIDPDSPLPNVLTDKGLDIIGNDFADLFEEVQTILFNKTNKEFEVFIDKCTNFIFSLIIKYGIEEYKSFFTYNGGASLVFRGRICSHETEAKALEICKDYIVDFSDNNDEIIDDIVSSLARYHNPIVLEKMRKWLEERPLDTYTPNPFRTNVLQHYSFNFVMGLIEKIYGNMENRTFDYSNVRKNSGILWEKLVGLILNENYPNIVYHKKLSNNTIPDYVSITDNKIDTIYECKLVLDEINFINALAKYNKYSRNLIFICTRKCVSIDLLEKNSHYLALKKDFPENFEFSIWDLDTLSDLTINYQESLENFQNKTIKFDRLKLLQERTKFTFPPKEAEYLLELLELTFIRSGL